MDYKIKDIDFDSEQHKKIIMKLCERNNFSIHETYFILYEQVKQEFINDTGLTQEKALQYMKDEIRLYENKTGKFICLKNKVCGFIYIGHTNFFAISEIIFLLIDKKYRNKGFGKALVEEAKKICKNEHTLRVAVEEKNVDYYTKFGFTEYARIEDNICMSITNVLNMFDILKMPVEEAYRHVSLMKEAKRLSMIDKE
jgi:ribosomal protein S18 acetylase RimI-like enzyme